MLTVTGREKGGRLDFLIFVVEPGHGNIGHYKAFTKTEDTESLDFSFSVTRHLKQGTLLKLSPGETVENQEDIVTARVSPSVILRPVGRREHPPYRLGVVV